MTSPDQTTPPGAEAMRETVVSGLWIALDMLSSRYGEWSPEYGHVFRGRDKEAADAIHEAIALLALAAPSPPSATSS